MRVKVTRAFERDLKRLSRSDQSDTVAALKEFIINPQSNGLNFERLKSRNQYHSIRSNYSTRVLLRRVEPDLFDVVAVGNHDYIYGSYFRK